MKWILVGTALLLPVAGLGFFTAPAFAQTAERPAHIPTPQKNDGPFGTQWAKPPGTTGSQIYNDPRNRDPKSSYRLQRNKPCPAPTLSDPASGGCR